jgi:ADP-ribosylglycohydrolase
MSKIRNSVYGLALGDALAYRTEFLSFRNAVTEYGKEDPRKLDSRLLISDDTQMSLYLVRGFRHGYNTNLTFDEQDYEVIEAISLFFIDWLNDYNNNRAPGMACISSLMFLNQEVSSLSYLKRKIIQHRRSVDDFLVGGERNSNSKGSGTVMRSPWIGVLNAVGTIPDNALEKFCNVQSSITHQHPTALHASYLTALLTSKLYKGELQPGTLGEYAIDFCKSQESDLGWRELTAAFEKINKLPKNYASLAAEELDPSSVIGSHGTAEDVLVTAIAIIDSHGSDPIDVLRRCMFTGGDSDTIGAVAGGILGAYYAENIWEEIEHLVEEQYVPELEDVITYMESL